MDDAPRTPAAPESPAHRTARAAPAPVGAPAPVAAPPIGPAPAAGAAGGRAGPAPTTAADFILAIPFDLDLELDVQKVRAHYGRRDGAAPSEGAAAGAGAGSEPPLAGRNAPIVVGRDEGRTVSLDGEELSTSAREEVWIYGFEIGLILVRFRLRRDLARIARVACAAERIDVGGRPIYAYADDRAASVRRELQACGCTRGRYEVLYTERDVYPVVVLPPGPDLKDAEAFLAENPGATIGIVGGEDQWERLSPFALSRSEIKNLGYYQDELIIAKEWGALISSRDEERGILALVFLAYAQRWALQSYNHLTNARQDEALRLLAQAKGASPSPLLSGRRLRAIAAKLFGANEDRIALLNAIRDFTSVPELMQDWHLHNLYQDLAKTFFLNDLYRLVVQKNEELEKAYASVHSHLMSSRLFAVEVYMVIVVALEGILLLAWFLSEIPH